LDDEKHEKNSFISNGLNNHHQIYNFKAKFNLFLLVGFPYLKHVLSQTIYADNNAAILLHFFCKAFFAAKNLGLLTLFPFLTNEADPHLRCISV